MKVICPDCGKEQDDNNKFCKNCGADLSHVKPMDDSVSIDSNSDDNIVDGDFSQKSSIDVPIQKEDGTNTNELVVSDLGTNSAEEETVDENVSIPKEESLSQSNIQICDNCGTELTPEVKFCPYCGKAVEVKEEKPTFKFCPSCGSQLEPGQKFCPNCGFNLDPSVSVGGTSVSGGTSPVGTGPVVEKKTPIVSVLLSFLFPGLGQFYNGQSTKGIYFIIFAIVSWILMIIFVGIILYIIVWLWSLIDAYNSAEALNRGEQIEDKLF